MHRNYGSNIACVSVRCEGMLKAVGGGLHCWTAAGATVGGGRSSLGRRPACFGKQDVTWNSFYSARPSNPSNTSPVPLLAPSPVTRLSSIKTLPCLRSLSFSNYHAQHYSVIRSFAGVLGGGKSSIPV